MDVLHEEQASLLLANPVVNEPSFRYEVLGRRALQSEYLADGLGRADEDGFGRADLGAEEGPVLLVAGVDVLVEVLGSVDVEEGAQGVQDGRTPAVRHFHHRALPADQIRQRQVELGNAMHRVDAILPEALAQLAQLALIGGAGTY
jgi:hypothetical protein